MTYVNAKFVRENPDALILDCRFKLSEPEDGRKRYDQSHVKGAVYVDLDKDMMGKLGEHGGRHPLPDMDEFRKTVEKLGVSDDVMVIIYDDAEFPSSSRLHFMLKLLGKDSYIVNGGFPALVAEGIEVDGEVPVPKPAKLSAKKNLDILVDIDYVLANKDKKNIALVDSRTPERYNGIEEPIDKIAGHIPGALNIFWKNVFTEDGFLKSEEELKEIYSQLKDYDEVIFYCGSGVTGAVNAVIYGFMGNNAKLYGGSYSDYVSYDGLELIIKDGKKITL